LDGAQSPPLGMTLSSSSSESSLGPGSPLALYLVACATFVGLYVAMLYSYNLFHSLVEIFSVVIACGVFLFAWNSRRLVANGYLLYVGIAYLFVGAIDLVHTLAYRGMGVFVGFDTNLPTQLWIGARYLQALSLLVAPWFLRERALRPGRVIAAYVAIVGAFLLSVFYWRIFPTCFVEGQGLTPFKVASEYVISLILLGAALLLWRRRERLERDVLRLLLASIGVTIAQELAFTLYVDPYGLTNMLGHFLKIVAYYLVYRAIIATGLVRPFSLLLRDLEQTNERLSVASAQALVAAKTAEEHAARAEAASERVNTILESITDAFFALDREWCFTYVNAEAERLLRRRRADLLGASIADRFPEIVGTRFQQECSRAIADGVSVEFTDFYPPLGAWFTVHAYPSADGLAIYFQDVTELREMEQAREDFLRAITHDLRNPLTSVLGTAQMLLRHADRPEAVARQAETIAGSARRMNMMLGALVDSLRIEAGRMTPSLEPASVKSLLLDLDERTGGDEQRGRVRIELPEDLPVVLADPGMVERILANLVSNALKYGREGADVVVRAARREGEVVISVVDEGPGIAPEHLPRIFERYHRIAGDQGRRDGLGLGLYITRGLVEAMGGRIWVESRLGEGSAFHFTLPLAGSLEESR
jgi:signal transduction histidine kinase